MPTAPPRPNSSSFSSLPPCSSRPLPFHLFDFLLCSFLFVSVRFPSFRDGPIPASAGYHRQAKSLQAGRRCIGDFRSVASRWAGLDCRGDSSSVVAGRRELGRIRVGCVRSQETIRRQETLFQPLIFCRARTCARAWCRTQEPIEYSTLFRQPSILVHLNQTPANTSTQRTHQNTAP